MTEPTATADRPAAPGAHAPDGTRPLAVVTGATAGIGRVFAERFAARGHDLLLVARDGARLAAVAGELAARHGVAARGRPCDLTDDAATAALAAELAALPRVDALVNNAGFGTLGPLVRTDPEAQARMVRLHCSTPLRLAQAVLPGMTARRAGLVINVASVAAFMTGPGNGTYSATKSFLVLLTQGMAAELAGSGVRVQALCPGFTRTEFHGRAGMPTRAIPGVLWMTPAAIVDASLGAADRGGPTVVVPGLGYRIVVAVARHLPLRLFAWLTARGSRLGRGGAPASAASRR